MWRMGLYLLRVLFWAGPERGPAPKGQPPSHKTTGGEPSPKTRRAIERGGFKHWLLLYVIWWFINIKRWQ